jgi:hypothetical protein
MRQEKSNISRVAGKASLPIPSFLPGPLAVEVAFAHTNAPKSGGWQVGTFPTTERFGRFPAGRNHQKSEESGVLYMCLPFSRVGVVPRRGIRGVSALDGTTALAVESAGREGRHDGST